MMKNGLLIVVAHADDAEIFMGGTLIKHTTIGEVVLVVENNDATRTGEAIESSALLNISIEIVVRLDVAICEGLISKYGPKTVVTHYCDDFHPDHRRIFEIVTEAVKNTKIRVGLPNKYYSFDTYNSIGLNSYFIPDKVIDVSSEFDLKLKSIGLYRSQPVDHFKKMAIAMGKIWGSRIGCEYGEAFKINNILGTLTKNEYL